ncbi:MAG TPA: MFS transporter, partial [Actinopolymorphaceae bacterium]
GAGGYLTRLREGFDFLRGEPLLRSIVGMVAVTNLIDAAFAGVLLPVWAKQTGGGPAMIGLLGSLTGAFAIGGSLLAAWLAERLPRRATYLVGYFVAGAPRFVVLALDAPLWLTLGVFAVGGFGAGFINPIIGAVFYERVPRAMLGRTNALADAIAWAGIPFGGLAAGVLIGVMGLGPTFLVLGGAYLITTTLPGLRREWATMNRTAAHGQ